MQISHSNLFQPVILKIDNTGRLVGIIVVGSTIYIMRCQP